jgi:phosphopantetheinyl transferase (holo-ACP synthase)
MQKFLKKISKKFCFFFGIQNIVNINLQLNEKGNAYASSVLTDTEYSIFEKLKIKKRKAEWLSGRIASKRAFAKHIEFLNNSNIVSTISILNNQNRSPYIVNHPELHLSLSHSHEYAVAVIAPFNIGIDIEKIEPRPDSLAGYFCSQEERAVLETDPMQKDELMTFFWSRKEAVSKFLQLGGKLNFNQISTVNDKVEISKESIRLISEECDGYWISVGL